MLQNIRLFPNKEKSGEKSPDYFASASEQVNGQWVSHRVGAAWLKVFKEDTVIDIQLNKKSYTSQATGKITPAFHIVQAPQTEPAPQATQVQATTAPVAPQAQPATTPQAQPAPEEEIPTVNLDEDGEEEIKIENIPFVWAMVGIGLSCLSILPF